MLQTMAVHNVEGFEVVWARVSTAMSMIASRTLPVKSGG